MIPSQRMLTPVVIVLVPCSPTGVQITKELQSTRAIARYSDTGGRPIRQEERCHVHTVRAIDLARAEGLAVRDDRKT
jgi:hypothetical protein